MNCEVFPVGALQCNCTVLWDGATREAIVVDPGDGAAELTRLKTILETHQLTVKAIVITHAHIDHIGAAARLRRDTGAPVHLNSNDLDLCAQLALQAQWIGLPGVDQPEIDSGVNDGDTLKLADAELNLIHTPGHTQGSICIHSPSEKLLIAGDTLFRDSIGRTDLPGGDTRKILSSIHTKLLTLPEDTQVICGHGPSTTIGREKERNPFLRL